MADNDKLTMSQLIDEILSRFMLSMDDEDAIADARDRIEQLINETFDFEDEEYAARTMIGLRLEKLLRPTAAQPIPTILRDAVGITALVFLISQDENYKPLLDELGAVALAIALDEHLKATYEAKTRRNILEAAIRTAVGFPKGNDHEFVISVIEEFQKEQDDMSDVPNDDTGGTNGNGGSGGNGNSNGFFYFDQRTLPKQFRGETTDAKDYRAAYLKAVREGVAASQDKDDPAKVDDLLVAAVTGLMLLDERFDHKSPNFRKWVIDKAVYVSGSIPVPKPSDEDHQEQRKAYFVTVENVAKNTPGRTGMSYRELAYAAQEMIEKEPPVPTDSPQFGTMVNVALATYIAGEPDFGRLELPPLLVDEAIDSEIEPDNIRAVAMIYAGYHMEQMRLFDVVDRVMEIFMNGQLAIGVGAAGAALDGYYWNSEDRMSQAARYSHYSRVLGVAGGDVSREVQPNTEFNNLWLRFLSSVAEYDRQQRVADLLDKNNGQRSLATTIEHVRKAGRDLAANVSLYGWASTHYAAKRLSRQIELSFNILRQSAIQRAYAATGPFQVIERVTSAEFRQVPNIVRHRTMADAGNSILNIMAAYPTAWTSGSARQPLFSEPPLLAGRTAVIGIIPSDKVQELLRQTQYWLAVMGVQDSQIDQLSQPVETPSLPTIPSGNGFGGGSPDMDRLRQMVSQGQIPSMDELKSVFSVNGSGS